MRLYAQKDSEQNKKLMDYEKQFKLNQNIK